MRTLAASVAALAMSAGPASAALPQTGFEVRGGGSWTTPAEEQAFIRDLQAATPRVAAAQIGQTHEGRPLQLLTVGPAKAQADIKAGSSILLVCTQHGDEPAGREACLQVARDHAASGDPATILIIPTANPDGLVRNTTENAQGINPNRDHEALTTAEAGAVRSVIDGYRPDITMDLHEYSSGYIPAHSADEVQTGVPTHPATAPSIIELARQFRDNYTAPALVAAGYEHGNYTFGAGELSRLKEKAASLSSVSQLIESPFQGLLSPLSRVRAHKTAVNDAGLRMLRERFVELAVATGSIVPAQTATTTVREPAARPTLTVRIRVGRATVRALRGGLLVAVRCSSACRVSLRLTHRGKTVARGAGARDSAGVRKVTVRLTPRGARRIRRASRGRLRLRGVVTSEQGSVRTIDRTVKIVRPSSGRAPAPLATLEMRP